MSSGEPAEKGDKPEYDVIVVGLGGMGSAAAYHLASRGKRVLGLEQYGVAHDRGSSHGASRIVRQAYFEDPAYVPLLLRSYELWDELNAHGADVFTRTGGLYLGRPESPTVAGSLAAAREYALTHEVLNAEDVRERFRQFAIEDDEVGLWEASAGLARPELTVRTHIDLATDLGADLRFEQAVVDWSVADDGVTVRTASNTYTAAHLVICAGPWASGLIDLDLPLQVERQVQFWFEPIGDRESFALGTFPIFIWHGRDGLELYGIPALDEGAATKVAFYRNGADADPDQLEREISDSEVKFVQDYLKAKIPALAGKFSEGRACMYTNTPDLHFVVGPHPRHPHVTIACGFSGHGFKFVPVIGEILADLALTGSTRHPIDLFAPTRFTR